MDCVAEAEEAGSEASERENRKREEQLAQMAEKEARLGGEELVVNLFSFGGGAFLSFPLSGISRRVAGSLNLTSLGCGVTALTHP